MRARLLLGCVMRFLNKFVVDIGESSNVHMKNDDLEYPIPYA